MPLTIGITDCNEWANYERWIKGADSDIGVVMLKAGEGETSYVTHCDGVVLTGGEDVHPSLYGKPEYVQQYKLTDCNPERDKFEFGVLDETEDFKIPLLGICRGLQLANVYFKGALIPDLPTFGKTIHSAPIGGQKGDVIHDVTLKKSSRLRQFIGVEKGIVNSHHHQAAPLPQDDADGIGKGLVATAISDDNVVEGMEKDNKHDKEFFMLVQWHPERMELKNPFSGKLREAFINACREYNRFTSLNQSLSVAP